MCVCVCCFEKVDLGEVKRKLDVNETALINLCLISYSALSGHGKERGEERDRVLGGVHEKVQVQPQIHSLC